VSGTLIRKPSLKMITILQRDLQPKRINESLTDEKSVWRSASQEWLKEFIDNEGFIDHKDKFISFSFDPESGGQDSFGGEEIVIEFDKDLLLAQARSQELGEVEYDPYYMEQHPDVALYVLGHDSEKSYYASIGVKNQKEAWESVEMDWDGYIESFEHEQEIVMRKLSDEEGLIKEIVFNKPADLSLVNRLRRKGIPYRLKEGLENDPQQKLHFESLKEYTNFERGIDPKNAMDLGLLHLKDINGVSKEGVPFITNYQTMHIWLKLFEEGKHDRTHPPEIMKFIMNNGSELTYKDIRGRRIEFEGKIYKMPLKTPNIIAY
jgi:hypothetical protein